CIFASNLVAHSGWDNNITIQSKKVGRRVWACARITFYIIVVSFGVFYQLIGVNTLSIVNSTAGILYSYQYGSIFFHKMGSPPACVSKTLNDIAHTLKVIAF